MSAVEPLLRVRGEVETTESLPAATFRRDFEAVDRPVVVRGGARATVAFERWSPESLAEKIGHVRAHHKRSVTNKHPDFDQPTLAASFAREESTLGELIAAVTTGPEAERAQRLFTGDEKFLLRKRDGVTTLDPELAPLYDDVGLPELVPGERLYTVWAWFSGRGVRTWLHYDNNGCHNLNVQVTGHKDCLLFEPLAVEPFYFFDPSGKNPAHNCSAVDVDAPDPKRFPRFAEARAWRASIGPGDLLFIPAWWPHAFFHHGAFNANVNFWWMPDGPRENAISRRQGALDELAPKPTS